MRNDKFHFPALYTRNVPWHYSVCGRLFAGAETLTAELDKITCKDCSRIVLRLLNREKQKPTCTTYPKAK